jgi:hypothetical protein
MTSVTVLTSLLMTRSAPAQVLSGIALVQALRHGGYVLVMRHASSPSEAPTKQSANADNIHLERQLDDNGRATTIAVATAPGVASVRVWAVMSPGWARWTG